MSSETVTPQSDERPSLDEILAAIQHRQQLAEEPAVEIVEPPQTRAEVKVLRTKQEIDDLKRAGRLVMKVLDYGALQDQIVPVDGVFSRGRTSRTAVALAQQQLLAHGIITDHQTMPSPANAAYDAQQAGDVSPDIDVLRVTGIDEDKANQNQPKHAR